MKCFTSLLFVLLCALPVAAQGPSSGGPGPTQNVAYRFRRLIADPATCNPGDVYFNTVSTEYRKCATANTWSDFGSGGGGGANTALSNLAAVAINTDLVFAATTLGVEFGTSSQNILTYVNGTGPRFADGNTGNLLTFNVQSLLVDRTVTWPNANTSIPIASQFLTFTGPTAARTYTFPDANATLIHGALGATDNAIPRANGTGGSTLQASGVTIDDSNNVSTPGSITTGAGGSVAGNIGLGAGSATSVAADTVQLQAPAAVTGYNIIWPAAAGDGGFLCTNSTNVVTCGFQATSGSGNFARVGSPTFTTQITTPVVVSGAADPADAGVLRLGNNEAIGWENSTPGTDLTLKVNTSNIFELSADLNVGTSPDVGIGRAAAGKAEINSGTGGQLRDLSLRQLFISAAVAGGSGNQTVNQPAFVAIFAASGTAVTITNSFVTTSSLVICTPQTNDTTLKSVVAVPGSGSVVLTANAAATGTTNVACLVINQ